ncbi:hypothetical protein CEXT_450811 [Caerostris extrusa]|uniref:Uncharacterized protein n=1 Tax=Caerostris extrusa TaxID=172846 RepID=A0AAV4QJG9_CAEEX|nr:hypothetical protein CEXT_450811 [Caerostris extrusa]
MVSASLVNERSHEARQIAKRVLHQIPASKNETEIKLNDRLTHDNNLTLWKIYSMDRSLIIAGIATLITYGILLGTLADLALLGSNSKSFHHYTQEKKSIGLRRVSSNNGVAFVPRKEKNSIYSRYFDFFIVRHSYEYIPVNRNSNDYITSHLLQIGLMCLITHDAILANSSVKFYLED